MRVVAIVQARMDSTRLPGKVLRDLAGEPMVGRVIERLRRVQGIDQIQVAISRRPADDPLLEHLSRLGDIGVTRGPEEDVLARFVQAADESGAEIVVRITADCPLLSPTVSHRVVGEFLRHRAHCDYVSNTLRRTFPRGLDTEAFSYEALRVAHLEAESRADREHVTPFIWRQPQRFRLRSVVDSVDRSHHRWTVDTREDFELMSRIYAELHPRNPDFDYEEILSCLAEHPDWARLNRNVRHKCLAL